MRPEALDEVRAKAADAAARDRRAEPIGSWAGLRPAGRGFNYVIRRRDADALVNVAAIRSTGLTASLGIAEHVAEMIAPGARREAPLRRGRRAAADGRGRIEPWWPHERFLLGIDEGTTAVKARPLRRATCAPLREARRRKPSRHPRPGWVERDPGRSSTRRRRGRRAARGRAGRGRRLRARPPGRVRARLGRRDRRAAVPGRRLAGQARARSSTGWRGTRTRSVRAAGCRSIPTSRPASSLAARATGSRCDAARCGSGTSTPGSPTASARDSPPTRRRPRAPSCTGSATRAGTRGCASASASRSSALPRGRRQRRRSRLAAARALAASTCR